MKDKEMIEEIETIIKSNLAEGSFANAFARKVAIQIVEHYQPKLPEDTVANQKLFDEFVKFAKDKFNLTIVKDDTQEPITFEELFGKVFEDSVVLSKEEYENIYEQAEQTVLANIADGGTSCHWCMEQHEKKARKETAEKILNKCDEFYHKYISADFAFNVFIKWLKEEFGVEIKE